MIRCDALIVGGGPAGLAAAIALRLKGLDVVVADALRPPIDKACGEGLLPDSQVALARLGVSLSADDGASFEGIACLSERACVRALFAQGRGIGVRRIRLHERLSERAAQLGVRFAWGSPVLLTPDRPTSLNGSECLYRYLVGADGQSSRVRRWSGLYRESLYLRRFGARRHFRIPSAGPSARMVEVHWGDAGQAYITPIAEDEICVAAVARSSSLGMEGVLAGLPGLRRRLAEAIAITPLRGAITTTRKLRRVTADKIVLVGDASGSVDAVTGEGLALSFRQSLLLAEAIAAGDLSIYEAKHPAILHLPQIMARAMLSMDRRPWLRGRVLSALAHDPRLFERMLALHLGEQPLGAFLAGNALPMSLRLLISPA